MTTRSPRPLGVICRLWSCLLVCVCLASSSRCCLGAAQRTNGGTADYLAGLDLLADGRWAEAQAAFSKAIDADEEVADYYTARGIAKALGGNPRQSEPDFVRALRLRPGDNEARLWHASAVAMQGDFMRDGTIYPYAQHKKPYENLVREVTRVYGQGNWMQQQARRENWEGPDLQRAMAQQKEAAAKFPELAKRFVARVKSANPDLAGALVDRVKQQFDRGDYAGCVSDLDRLLAASPDDLTLVAMYARCALELGAPAVAREYYTRVLTKNDDADGYVGRARAAARMGDNARAQADLAIACALNPSRSTDYRAAVGSAQRTSLETTRQQLPALLARLHEHAGQPTAWKDLVDEASELIRAVNRHRLRLDESYADRLRELRLAAARSSSNPDALANLGEFLYRSAVDVRTEAVEPRAERRSLRPMTKDSQAAEVADAERALDAALQINPNHLQAMTFKAACLIHRLRWGDAETLLKRALELKADDPMVLRLFARVLDHAAAVKAARAANLRSVTSWSDLNWIYTRYPSEAELAAAAEYQVQAERLWALAMQALEAAVEARKGTAEGYYYLGVLERRRGSPQAAKTAFEQSIQLNPNDVAARDELVAVCSELRLVEQALLERSAADNLLHTTAGSLLRLTWLMIPQTKFRSARQALDQAAGIDPADPRVAAYRGVLAEEKEDKPGAVAWYRAAAALMEAHARHQGTASRALRPHFDPADVAMLVAVNVKAGRMLLSDGRREDASELFRAVMDLEPRIDADELYTPLSDAMLPDPHLDPTRVPEANHMAYYLAWSHYGYGKVMFEAGQFQAARQAAERAQAYELHKPPTVDCGMAIRAVTSRAALLVARAALAMDDRQTAERLVRSNPRGYQEEDMEELRQLEAELERTAPREVADDPQRRWYPPRRRGR